MFAIVVKNTLFLSENIPEDMYTDYGDLIDNILCEHNLFMLLDYQCTNLPFEKDDVLYIFYNGKYQPVTKIDMKLKKLFIAEKAEINLESIIAYIKPEFVLYVNNKYDNFKTK